MFALGWALTMRNGFLPPREVVAKQVYNEYVRRSELENALADQPFWRFRRKQALRRRMLRIRKAESAGVELLGGRPGRD